MSSNEDQSWIRRFRSSSFSSDLTVEGLDNVLSNPIRQDSVEFKKRNFKRSSERNVYLLSALESRKSMPPEDFLISLQSAQEAWKDVPDHFPFLSLPKDLQILIFNYLTPVERGSVATVCKKWYQIVRSPDLWWFVDLISFPPSPSTLTDTDDEDYDESIVNYTKYQRRTRKFINFLITIRPKVKKLRFAFDIADIKDGWMEGIETLLHSCHLQEIRVAEIIWNETPAKPAILDSVSITWCTSDYKDLMYKHRHRQRYFVKFFDLFTSLCASLVHLVVPFDWTERSIRSLARLTNLKSVVLPRYFIFQNFDQKQIDSLLRAIPNVTHLTFEVWTPSGRGLQSIKFHSETLLSLDTSQCRGIKLDRDLHLPNLLKLSISINPMKGPMAGGPADGRLRGYDTDDEELGVGGCSFSSSCLYDVLRVGAPCLTCLNNLELEPDWRENSNPDLEQVLNDICLCPRHTVVVPPEAAQDDDDDGGGGGEGGDDDDGDGGGGKEDD